MVVGRCITLVGCIMYIFVEFIPSGRRWWMLVCYMLFGVGFGMHLFSLYFSYTHNPQSDSNQKFSEIEQFDKTKQELQYRNVAVASIVCRACDIRRESSISVRNAQWSRSVISDGRTK